MVIDANGLTSAQKLAVAQRVGLTETAFVSNSASATIKLDFFTPTRQIAHCGHATIAAFSLRRQRGLIGTGRLSKKETIDGNRDARVDGGMVFMEQRAPRYTPVPSASEPGLRALASLHLTPAHLMPGVEPCVVNTGNAFLLVPLRDEPTVAGVQPDLDRVAALSDELDLIGYYIFSRVTRGPGRHAGTRMFAPRFGIREEAGQGWPQVRWPASLTIISAFMIARS